MLKKNYDEYEDNEIEEDEVQDDKFWWRYPRMYVSIKVTNVNGGNATEVYNSLLPSMAEGKIRYVGKERFKQLMPNLRAFYVLGSLVAVVGIVHWPDHKCSEIVKLCIKREARKLKKLKKHVLNVAQSLAHEDSEYIFACGVGSKNIFTKHGFRKVSKEDVPSGKWTRYPKHRHPWVVRMERRPK